MERTRGFKLLRKTNKQKNRKSNFQIKKKNIKTTLLTLAVGNVLFYF